MERHEDLEVSFLAAIAEQLDAQGVPEQAQWPEARRLLEAAFRAVETEVVIAARRGAA